MIIDDGNKSIQVKIVYFGPALSGKTTSLKSLFNMFGKGNLVDSIESTTGRTLIFDFGSLEFKGGLWKIKFLIYTTTGQDYYKDTRPTVLNGVDGIIFIGDFSESDFPESSTREISLRELYEGDLNEYECFRFNLTSWNELKMLPESEQTDGNKNKKVPVVIALNKQDLKIYKSMENFFAYYIDKIGNKDNNKIRIVSVEKTIAIDGKGILKSFSRLVMDLFPKMSFEDIKDKLKKEK